MFSHEVAQLILLTLFMYNNNGKKQKEYKKEKKMGHVKERLPVVWPGCKWIKVKEGRNEIV